MTDEQSSKRQAIKQATADAIQCPVCDAPRGIMCPMDGTPDIHLQRLFGALARLARSA